MIAEHQKSKKKYNYLDDSKKVSDFIKRELKFFRSYYIEGDKVFFELESISYQSLNQYGFELYFDRALAVMSEISIISISDLLQNWEQFQNGVQE
jgi:hypothetical protein